MLNDRSVLRPYHLGSNLAGMWEAKVASSEFNRGDDSMNDKEQVVMTLLRDWLLDAWLDTLGWDMADLLQALERGIPQDWADGIEEQSHGRVPASSWPKLIKPPRFTGRVVRPPSPEVRPVVLDGRSGPRDTDWRAKIGVSMTRRKHPAQLHLNERGVTISALYRELKSPDVLRELNIATPYSRSAVSSWFSENVEHPRGIPERVLDYLNRKHKVPREYFLKVLRSS